MEKYVFKSDKDFTSRLYLLKEYYDITEPLAKPLKYPVIFICGESPDPYGSRDHIFEFVYVYPEDFGPVVEKVEESPIIEDFDLLSYVEKHQIEIENYKSKSNKCLYFLDEQYHLILLDEDAELSNERVSGFVVNGMWDLEINLKTKEIFYCYEKSNKPSSYFLRFVSDDEIAMYEENNQHRNTYSFLINLCIENDKKNGTYRERLN